MSLIHYPKVSIMVPTYNQENYIGQAIESALNQDYLNLEIIVADDCSRDETPIVIRRYLGDSRLKYFRNSINLGKAGNYRKLLYNYASGDWVIMLDGDDYLIDNQFVSIAIAGIINHDNVVAVISGHKVSYPDVEYIHMPSEVTRLADGYDLFMNFQKITPGHSSIIYKRELAAKVGAYRFNIMSDDYEMILRLLLHGKALLLNRVVSVWRHHERNISHTLDFDVYMENVKFIEEPYKYAVGLGHDRNKLKRWRRRMLSWYLGAYITNNVRLLRMGIITKKQADKNINELIKFLVKRESTILLDNIKIPGKIIIYKLAGTKFFEFLASCKRDKV